MRNSPQIYRRARRARTLAAAVKTVLLFAGPFGTLAGCDAGDPAGAQASNSSLPAPPAQRFEILAGDEPPSRPTSPGVGTPDVRIEDSWTYAPSLAAFHQVWQDRFALSVGATLQENALLPYADALAFQGASWGIDPSDIRLIVAREDGAQFSLAGPHHPNVEQAGEADRLQPDAYASRLWLAVKATPGPIHEYDGLTFRLGGPIVARRSCNECHRYTEGAVVGVLSYKFSEIPDD